MPMKPEDVTQHHILAMRYAAMFGSAGPVHAADDDAINAYRQLIAAGLMSHVGARDNGCPICELTDAGWAVLALMEYQREGLEISILSELRSWATCRIDGDER